MKILKFKTNINCGSCISTVTPYLNQLEGTKKWHVDTENKDKVLEIETENITPEQVKDVVTQAGFKIESFEKKGFIHNFFG